MVKFVVKLYRALKGEIMKKKIIATISGIVLTVACVLGTNTPATNIDAEEPTLLTVSTRQMLEDHKAEYEAGFEEESNETVVFAEIQTEEQTENQTEEQVEKQTEDQTEDPEAEVEAEKALQDERCREMYENRIEDYKLQAETSLDRVAKNSQNAEKGDFIGNYQLTAYIATGNRCASGVYPQVNHTVACNSLPLGTKIYIEGYGQFVVEDTGGMGSSVIDIFVSDYYSAIQFGRRSAEVYIIEE